MQQDRQAAPKSPACMVELQNMRTCRRILSLSLSIAVAGCAATTTPPAGPLRAIGAMAVSMNDTLWRRRAFEQRHGGCTSHPAVAEATRIVAHLSAVRAGGAHVRVKVLRSDAPNAYILADGNIYMTLGMLDMICSEDDLAAVLAHELSHLDDPSAFDTRGMTEDERLRVEAEADDRAVLLLIEAGYEPVALGRMISKLTDEQPAGWAMLRCQRLQQRIGPENRVVLASFAGDVTAFSPGTTTVDECITP